MRPITVALATLLSLSALARPARAQDHGVAVRSLSRRVTELRSEVNRSYLRMRVLAEDLLGDDRGGRIRLVQRDETGALFRLVAASYALDGEPILTRRDPTGTLGGAELTILDGPIGPGEHTLSVVLRYEGEGLGVAGYMPGYRFVLRSSYSFVAPRDADRLDVVVRPYSRGPLVPYEERLGIEYEQP